MSHWCQANAAFCAKGETRGGEKNKVGLSELDVRFVSVFDRLQIIFVLKALSLSYESLYESTLKFIVLFKVQIY